MTATRTDEPGGSTRSTLHDWRSAFRRGLLAAFTISSTDADDYDRVLDALASWTVRALGSAGADLLLRRAPLLRRDVVGALRDVADAPGQEVAPLEAAVRALAAVFWLEDSLGEGGPEHEGDPAPGASSVTREAVDLVLEAPHLPRHLLALLDGVRAHAFVATAQVAFLAMLASVEPERRLVLADPAPLATTAAQPVSKSAASPKEPTAPREKLVLNVLRQTPGELVSEFRLDESLVKAHFRPRARDVIERLREKDWDIPRTDGEKGYRLAGDKVAQQVPARQERRKRRNNRAT